MLTSQKTEVYSSASLSIPTTKKFIWSYNVWKVPRDKILGQIKVDEKKKKKNTKKIAREIKRENGWQRDGMARTGENNEVQVQEKLLKEELGTKHGVKKLKWMKSKTKRKSMKKKIDRNEIRKSWVNGGGDWISIFITHTVSI